MAQLPASAPRDYRLDLLKGVAICMVMLWHVMPLRNFVWLPVFVPTTVFNREISVTAVPVFFTVSLMPAHSTQAERPFRRKPNSDSAPSRTPRSEATRLLC